MQRDLDTIARTLHAALRDLAGPAPAFALALPPLVAEPAPIVKAPEFPQSATFIRDDLNKTVFLNVTFPSALLQITPVYGSDGFMTAADFAAFPNE